MTMKDKTTILMSMTMTNMLNENWAVQQVALAIKYKLNGYPDDYEAAAKDAIETYKKVSPYLNMDKGAVNDSLLTDTFIEQLRTYADMQSQIGERDRALIVSKAAQIIQVIVAHCIQYQVGIPAQLINSIMTEKH